MGEGAFGSLFASACCKEAIAEGDVAAILRDRWHLLECVLLEESSITTQIAEFPLHWGAEGGVVRSVALVGVIIVWRGGGIVARSLVFVCLVGG